MRKVIDSFSGTHRWLSNFWPVEIMIHGITYPTIEHAYQAIKSLDKTDRLRISQAGTPAEAKRMGRTLKMRPWWNDEKRMFMQLLLEVKFERGTPLAELLLETGDAHLIEGNHWGDTFWGVCNGVGDNILGKLLMDQRSRLNS